MTSLGSSEIMVGESSENRAEGSSEIGAVKDEDIFDLDQWSAERHQWEAQLRALEELDELEAHNVHNVPSHDDSEAGEVLEAQLLKMKWKQLLDLLNFMVMCGVLLGVLVLIGVWAVMQDFKPKKPSFDVVQLSGGQSMQINVPENKLSTSMSCKLESRIHNGQLRVMYEAVSYYMSFTRNDTVLFNNIECLLPVASQAHAYTLNWDLIFQGTATGTVPDASALLLIGAQSGNVTGVIHVRAIEKWKSFRLFRTSGNYTIHVDCPVTINVVSDSHSVYGPCNVSYV